MPVSINAPRAAPQEERRDPLDTILKGLDVAAKVYGVVSDVSSKSDLEKEKELETVNKIYDTHGSKVGGEIIKQMGIHDPFASLYSPKVQTDNNSPPLGRAQPQAPLDQSPLNQLPSKENRNLVKDEDKAIFVQNLKNQSEGTGQLTTRDPVTGALSFAPIALSKEKQLKLEGEELTNAEKKKNLSKDSTDQSNAALFAKRMEQSEQVFKELDKSGFDPSSFKTGVQSTGAFPEILKSDEVKKLQQAKRNFITATLRRESGAAISPSEFEEGNKIYFPQVGDSPDLIKQKAQTRALAVASFKQSAGPAYGKIKVPAEAPVTKLKTGGPPVDADLTKMNPAQLKEYIKTHGGE